MASGAWQLAQRSPTPPVRRSLDLPSSPARELSAPGEVASIDTLNSMESRRRRVVTRVLPGCGPDLTAGLQPGGILARHSTSTHGRTVEYGARRFELRQLPITAGPRPALLPGLWRSAGPVTSPHRRRDRRHLRTGPRHRPGRPGRDRARGRRGGAGHRLALVG